ncbi:GGDEF domain-containing protein [Alteromonas sp. ASW11-36]|uniref:diguanylate cyclase n=1 Tax=Alteromonas arenosi TaxID=3055817 RepID=A0ABT7T067_9ALTE|nr:GGDEF domain-containing protein [Alteromonas sp. ASW11-36]MDM7861832.1 GGDEF domain-containing protein [Alteromonas sp. ASW11-36]
MVAKGSADSSSALRKRLDSIFSHSYTLAVADPFAAILILYIFRSSLDLIAGGIWLALIVALSIARVRLFKVYKRVAKRTSTLMKFHTWFIAFCILQGALYGMGWVYLLQLNDPIVSAIVALGIIAISAFCAVGYAADWRAIIAFVTPVILPGLIGLVWLGANINYALALMVLLYSIVMIKTTRPVNRSIHEAYNLNEQLQQQIAIREEAEAKLLALSRQDGLTQLANRRYFDECLDIEMRRAKRDASSVSLVIIDVDSFKTYNDHYGHLQGDECLVKVAHVLANHTRRAGELAARFGGEEFALILPNMSAAEAHRRIESINNTLRELAIEHRASLVADTSIVTISSGVTDMLAADDSLSFIRRADKALYAAKSAGRNRAIRV